MIGPTISKIPYLPICSPYSPPPLPCGVEEFTPQGKPSPVKGGGELEL